MNDLISSLADQIIALVNSKPSSPRKEEVEAVVRECLHAALRMSIDAGALASYPGFLSPPAVRKAVASEEIKAGDPIAIDWAKDEARKLGLIDECQERCRVYMGGHEFTLWGKDKNGLLCMPNDQWDVTGGSVLRCTCGAEPSTEAAEMAAIETPRQQVEPASRELLGGAKVAEVVLEIPVNCSGRCRSRR
jgi:hypothetical protein